MPILAHSSTDPRPRLEVVNSTGAQLDFTSLENSSGIEFARIFGRALRVLPHMTIVRVLEQVYDCATEADGRVTTGGMERHIAKLDRALGEHFDVTVHTICRGSERLSKEVSMPGWRGSVVVHTVPDFGRDPKFGSREVQALCEATRADLVHLHQADSPLSFQVMQRLRSGDRLKGGIGLAVTIHNPPAVDVAALYEAPSRSRVQDLRIALGVIKESVIEEGVVLGTARAAESIAKKVHRRLTRPRSDAQQVYGLAASNCAHGEFAAAGLAAVSKYAATDFCGRPACITGVPMELDVITPAKVTREAQDEVRRYYNLEGEAVLLCHGRITPWKGSLQIPEVARHIREVSDTPFRIIMMGSADAAFLEELRETICACGVADHITIDDARDPEWIRHCLSISTAMIFPTQVEALGGSAIEASLMGVPVVAHRVGGVPEAVLHEETGILVDTGDVRAMAAACVRLMNDPELAHRLGAAGRHFASSLSAERVAQIYVEKIYGPQVLARRAASVERAATQTRSSPFRRGRLGSISDVEFEPPPERSPQRGAGRRHIPITAVPENGNGKSTHLDDRASKRTAGFVWKPKSSKVRAAR